MFVINDITNQKTMIKARSVKFFFISLLIEVKPNKLHLCFLLLLRAAAIILVIKTKFYRQPECSENETFDCIEYESQQYCSKLISKNSVFFYILLKSVRILKAEI